MSKQVPVFTEAQLAGACYDLLGRITTRPPFDKIETPLFSNIFKEWAEERGLNIDNAEVETWDSANKEPSHDQP